MVGNRYSSNGIQEVKGMEDSNTGTSISSNLRNVRYYPKWANMEEFDNFSSLLKVKLFIMEIIIIFNSSQRIFSQDINDRSSNSKVIRILGIVITMRSRTFIGEMFVEIFDGKSWKVLLV